MLCEKSANGFPSFVAENKRFPTVEEMALSRRNTRDSMRAYLPHILGIQSLNVNVNNAENNGSALIDLIPIVHGITA